MDIFVSFYIDSKWRKTVRFSVNFNAILRKPCDSRSWKKAKKTRKVTF